jgi:hypothetical protein
MAALQPKRGLSGQAQRQRRPAIPCSLSENLLYIDRRAVNEGALGG